MVLSLQSMGIRYTRMSCDDWWWARQLAVCRAQTSKSGLPPLQQFVHGPKWPVLYSCSSIWHPQSPRAVLPSSFTAFGATVSHGLDPLTQSLYVAHSAYHMQQPNMSMFAMPFMQGFSGTHPSAPFGIVQDKPSAFFPSQSNTVIQVVDSTGCSICQWVNETLYSKKDPFTWVLDTTKQMGPPNSIFFSMYFAWMGSMINSQFMPSKIPVPATWQVYLVVLQVPWSAAFLTPARCKRGESCLPLGESSEPNGHACFRFLLVSYFKWHPVLWVRCVQALCW